LAAARRIAAFSWLPPHAIDSIGHKIEGVNGVRDDGSEVMSQRRRNGEKAAISILSARENSAIFKVFIYGGEDLCG